MKIRHLAAAALAGMVLFGILLALLALVPDAGSWEWDRMLYR